MIHFLFIFFSDVPEETVEIWDQDKINRAVANVSKKQTEFKKAKKMFTVSKIALRRYVNIKEEAVLTKLGRKPVFFNDMERGLIEYLLMMEQ
jgi:hypothetical protein